MKRLLAAGLCCCWLVGCGQGPGWLGAGLIIEDLLDPDVADGQDGTDGLHCWDLDADGECTDADDANEDGFCDALDCRGPSGRDGEAGPTGNAGPSGDPGPQGPQGPPGQTIAPPPVVIVLPPAVDPPNEPDEDDDGPPFGRGPGDHPPHPEHPDKAGKP